MSIYQITRRASDVINNVKRQFGDEAGVQIEDDDIIRWINDAQQEISAQLRPIKGKATLAAEPDQATYTLPPGNAVQIESIHFAGRKIKNLNFAQAEEAMLTAEPAVSEKGVPHFWFEWAGEMTFYPAPRSDSPIVVYYTKFPEPIEQPGDFLGLSDKHYDSIVAYVMSKAYELDEEWNAAQEQRSLFLNRIGSQVDEELIGQNITYPTITLVDE